MKTLKCNLIYLLDQQFLCKKDVFEEKNNQVKMTVPIVVDNVQYVLCSFDIQWEKGSAGLFPFFTKKEKNHKICDYIMFCILNNQMYVLLVELKKGSEKVTDQLAAGECFAKFIVDTLNRVKGKNYSPVIRKIAIRDKHLRLKPTTQMKNVEYDESGFYTFRGSKFYVKQFLK